MLTTQPPLCKQETRFKLLWKITYQDRGGDHQTYSGTADLLVKVENVQDEPPMFIGLPYIKYVPEDFCGVSKKKKNDEIDLIRAYMQSFSPKTFV